MAGIFKAYDIRGIYGKDLKDETAVSIGRALATFGYQPNPVTSPPLSW